MYRHLIFVLFSQLAVGGLVCILPVPASAGKRFFRFCGLLSIAFLALALYAAPAGTWPGTLQVGAMSYRTAAAVSLAATVLLAALFVYGAMAERDALKRGALLLAGVAGTAGVLLEALHAVPAGAGGWASLIYAGSALASMLFLGSVVYAMILGHWYLVVPTLPNRPLQALARLIVGATAFKAVMIGAVLFYFWQVGGVETRAMLLRFLRFEDLFFSARVLFGLLGPGLLAYMIWETVRIHSTQSATGLLYVATVFVLIGEAFSRYLSYTTRLPV